MCGRFALTATPAEFEDVLGVVEIDDFPPRFNIAPTQPIHVVVAGPRREPGSNRPDRVAMLARWGFVPSWVKDTRQFPLLINARSETAAEKSSFRAAMRHRRVLIPASGFYEWKREGTRKSQAYWVRPKAGGLIAFGGLMETYAEPGGSEIDTAAILTTAANSRIAHIHERMPVVIRPGHFREWLDCVRNEPRDVVPLMAPVEEEFFEAIPVSEKVNKVANTGPDVQEPLGPETLQDARTDEKPRPDEGQLTLF